MSGRETSPPRRPLVTIGISTYNRARGYLRQALGSAVAQTYPHLEIVVSDNCSTDDTGAAVAEFGDARIRYFRQATNIGANNNFNFCLSQARGAYFLLLHDDDLIDPDFVQTCIDAVNGNPAVGVIRTGTRRIDAAGVVQRQTFNRVGGLSTGEFFLGWFSGATSLYLCSTLYNTQGLREVGGFQSLKNLLQDVVATARLAARMGRADVRDVKASFRRHESNSGSAARILDWCEDSLFLLELMCELAPEHRAAIRRDGFRFLCDQNYSRASRATNPLRAHLAVYRAFGYRRSPLRFLLARRLARTRRSLREALPLAPPRRRADGASAVQNERP
jgi:glycosyltransferase involved in cell wall biosynthesis